MIGSYGPRKENYVYKSTEEEAAKGMLARQSYHVKSKFVDDDKVCHISWEWKFEIGKDWWGLLGEYSNRLEKNQKAQNIFIFNFV